MLSSSPIGIEEAVESFTGYDEHKIAQRFGSEIGDLLENRPTTGMRAVAFVLVQRDLKDQDVKDPDRKAYEHVMGLTLKEIGDFFPDVEPELDPDQPVTPAGEGDDSAD